ncbi:MAG: nicotinate-nucleotide adenylyltransferase [Kangiellaceae bacterium]|jgi:nicotinate-nucleotide adenylyltransferase|nr:nicotinate-nucleotide adenylyltransferase [Kangiellaceae bacterium]
MPVNLRFIFGGTFNPIHFGHLRLIENIHNLAPSSAIHIMPCANPPHRPQPTVSAEHRLAMVELAIAGADYITADPRELNRQGRSYSWLSVQELAREFPEDAIVWVVGGDAAAKFNTWREWRSILSKVSLLVVDRAGHVKTPLTDDVAEQLTHCDEFSQFIEQPKGAYWRYNAPILDISSTQIRQLIAENSSSRFLLPDSVIEYIQQHKIYSH